MKFKLLIIFLFSFLEYSYSQINLDTELNNASQQLLLACKSYKDTINGIPHSVDKNGKFVGVNRGGWTSGFFAGNLWYAYEATGSKAILPYAKKWTYAVEKEQFTTDNHDVGFMIYCSFGNMLRLIKDTSLKKVIVQASRSLIKRYNPVVGCTKSWDQSEWNPRQYAVIIDNMMNLELLFAATKISGDSSFYKIAVSHANKTMQHHFRPDGSSFHVVDYDTLTGFPKSKTTQQGLSTFSSWARGQAWGLYGFIMCYRETKDKKYLKHAQKIAHFWMTNGMLPKDLIPYWDFNAPPNSCTPRDASAAAIVASALLELSAYVTTEKENYKKFALSTLQSLSSANYKAKVGENNLFILKHSVGAYPFNQEIDVPLVYADYYYLEALLRAKRLK